MDLFDRLIEYIDFVPEERMTPELSRLLVIIEEHRARANEDPGSFVPDEWVEEAARLNEPPPFDAEEFERFRADPKRQAMVKRILADEEPSE